MEMIEITEFKFSEIIDNAYPTYDEDVLSVNYGDFINGLYGSSAKTEYDALSTTERGFIDVLLNRYLLRDRYDSYVNSDFTSDDLSTADNIKIRKHWARDLHREMLNLAKLFSPLIDLNIKIMSDKTTTSSGTSTATSTSGGNNKISDLPDNGGSGGTPTSFTNWQINDNTADADTSTEGTATDKSNYSLADLIEKIYYKNVDIYEYSKRKLEDLFNDC